MYKLITDDYFDPEELLRSVDLSDEHNIVDLKNRVEASVVIWQKKMTHKDSKLSWGHNVSHEKRGMFEGRAENVLLLIKHRFPGIAQSALDISKIQCNKVWEAFTITFAFSDTPQCFVYSNALHTSLLPFFSSGCWPCHFGELLQDSGELSFHSHVSNRRCSQCGLGHSRSQERRINENHQFNFRRHRQGCLRC